MINKETLANSLVTIHLDRFQRNIKRVQEYLGPQTELMYTVKSGGYGHGLKEMASYAVSSCGIEKLATATIGEAVELRQDGYLGYLMVLGGIPTAAFSAIPEYNLVTGCYNVDLAQELNRVAEAVNKKVEVHIKLDTGMHRLGVAPGEELQTLLDVLKTLPYLQVNGCYSHLANADEEDCKVTNQQLDLFEKGVEQVLANGLQPHWFHTAGSDAIITSKRCHYNMVRPAAILYGYDTAEGVFNRLGVEPVLSWTSLITNVRTVPAGEGVGYSGFFCSEKDSRIAVAAFGASDGYLRNLVGKNPEENGYVLIHGQRAPVVAICMDQTMIDVTDLPEVKIGDKVTLIGQDGNEEITVYDLKARSKTTIGYVLASISPRPVRVYREN